MKEFLTTEGKWYIPIVIGQKKFDWRRGYIDVKIGEFVKFVEANKDGDRTGLEVTAKITYVIHSRDFPEHFGWNGPEFTIMQFDVYERF